MKTFSKTFFVPIAVLLLLLSSCTRLSNTELLTAETWKLTSLSSDDADPDFLNLVRVFESLAEYNYMMDGTFSISFSDSSLTADGGTWRFNGEESQLIVKQEGEDENIFNLINLDEDNLEYTYTDTSGTYNLVYGHP